MVRVNYEQIPALICNRKSFVVNSSGSMCGTKNPDYIGSFGKLNREEIDRFIIDQNENGIDYVVLSYRTPIAWVTKNGWVYKVTQSFPRVTMRHQGMLYLLH